MKIIIDGHGSEENHFRFSKEKYTRCKGINSYVEGGQVIDVCHSNEIIRNIIDGQPVIQFEKLVPDDRLIGDRKIYPRDMIEYNRIPQPSWIVAEAEVRPCREITINGKTMMEHYPKPDICYLTSSSYNEETYVKLSDIIDYYQNTLNEEFEIYWLACRA